MTCLFYRFQVNSANVREMCTDAAEEVRKQLHEELRGRMVCLKVDSCTKGARPFFGINAQFISEGKEQLRTLKVRQMTTSQDATNLKGEVLETAGDFGIHKDNIYTVTSDNGGNMVLATRLIGDEQEKGHDEDDDEEIPEDDPNAEALDDEQVWAQTEASCTALAGGDHRCQCVRCAAHTLQLAIEHALKADEEAVRTLAKTRVLSLKMRTVTARRQLANAKLPVPTHDNATRWSTKDEMLISVRKLKEFVQHEFVCEGGAAVNMDWDAVDHLIETLAPVKEATTKLQAEQHKVQIPQTGLPPGPRDHRPNGKAAGWVSLPARRPTWPAEAATAVRSCGHTCSNIPRPAIFHIPQ